MAISVLQKSKNSASYQVKPLTVTLPVATTAGSLLVVLVQAQKSGNPYNVGVMNSKTPNPIVTDDKSNIYTTVDSLVGVSQEVTSGLLQPDMSGYYSSAYVYVTAAAAGTQSVSVGAFYPDDAVSPIQPNGNLASPPNLNGRPVFDGGIHVQVFEVAGLSTGVDVHAHGSSFAANLGAGLITTSAAAIIFEIGLLIDSANLSPATGSTLQYSHALSSSHSVIQSTIVGSATASSGFGNALKYTGAVLAVSLK